MNKNSNIAKNQSRLAAMRLAELNATDKEDLINCASDMTKTASLDNSEALVVAQAIRAKYLPNIAKQAGLVMSGLDLENGKETVDFANDSSDDNENDLEFHHFESDDDSDDVEMDDMSDDMDDEDEVDDSDDVATFEIEVPADMVDAAQQAVQEALDNLLGGEDMSEDMDEEMSDDDMSDDDMSDDEMSDDDEVTYMHKNSNEVRKMTKQALAERKAQREALLRRAEREEILKKIASEEEVYPAASAGFKYNNEMANMPGEQKVPTVNPGSLQFPDVTKPTKFEGSGDGSLEYTVDWKSLENPSEGAQDDIASYPSQMPSMPHKATRTSSVKHSVECTACGTKMAMTEEEMEDDNTVCANSKCPTRVAYMDNEDEAMMDEDDEAKNGEDENDDLGKSAVNTNTALMNSRQNLKDTNQIANDAATMKNIQNQTSQVSQQSFASVETARIKTAYSCSSKLAVAGVITFDEVDSYAEQMLTDNLKADSMIRQTKLLLKSAQSATERVAAAAAERMGSVRTASNLGISTSPAFSGGQTHNNSAALDIQGALKGTWTMPTIED
jgi:hypothetical protein